MIDQRTSDQSSRPVPGPVLVHIGYHKTGSGWLRRLFFSNPQTGFGWLGKDPGKHPIRRLVSARPLDFDSAAYRAEFEQLMQPLAAAGLSPVLSFERLTGHPYSGGYDSKEIADRLRAVFPEGRVLVVLREQRSMIVSTYKQYVREGGACPPNRFMVPPTSRSMRVPLFDWRHFEYDRLLAYYRHLFGPEAVLALTYEQFVEDPGRFVAAIAEFAGITLDGEVLASLPFDIRSNPAPSAAALAVRRPLNRLGVLADLNPSAFLDSKQVVRLARRVERTTFVPRRLAARSEAQLWRIVTEAVGDRYVESNRRTAELTGIDFPSYGWML
jgi:hypothetical protein